MIFIAGNEPFTQGPVDYREGGEGGDPATGITVNTIHCGSEAAGLAAKWKQAALLADGRFSVHRPERWRWPRSRRRRTRRSPGSAPS